MRPLLALSLLVVARQVSAQRPDSLRDTARIAPVVVTATSTPLSLDRVPASVTVLDGAALRAQGLTHVADALREVPGMAVVQSGSYGAPTSLFTRGAQNNYTKVLVDGVPLNDPGGALDLGLLTLDDVERIEVLRGPASVLYGSDAVAGVVQIFTRHASARPHGSFDARGGTYGSYDADATVDAPFGGLRTSLGGAHHVTDGIYDFNSRYRNDVGNASLTTSWTGGEVTGTARYNDAIAHYPTDFTGAPIDPNAYRTEKRTLVGTNVRQQIGSALATLALTSNLANEATFDAPNNPLITRTFRQAADLRVGMPVASAFTLTLGSAAERQHQASPNYDRRNEAAYAEVVHSGELTTTLGARLDHSSTFGDFATYRASASRLLPGAYRVRASLGTAFREPSFYESFDTPFSAANPDLRPERTTSWETGIEHDVAAGAATVGATYFSQRFIDLIDYRFDAANPAQSQYENIARARAAGAELELRVAPVRGVSGDASYTWLDTKVLQSGFDPSPEATLVSGGPLLRRPKHSGSVGVRYEFLTGFSAVARATYVGAREDRLFHGAPNYNTDDVTLDPYTKVDFSFVAPLWRSLDATLRADNVFDTRYVSVAGYATPGRVITAGVRASF